MRGGSAIAQAPLATPVRRAICSNDIQTVDFSESLGARLPESDEARSWGCLVAGILAFVTMIVMNSVSTQFDPLAATWRVRTTDHFEIYYAEPRGLDSVAREAERAYSRVSRDRRQQVSGKVPLILLPTKRDLPHTEQEAAV